jgi:hypothetical protein
MEETSTKHVIIGTAAAAILVALGGAAVEPTTTDPAAVVHAYAADHASLVDVLDTEDTPAAPSHVVIRPPQQD